MSRLAVRLPMLLLCAALAGAVSPAVAAADTGAAALLATAVAVAVGGCGKDAPAERAQPLTAATTVATSAPVTLSAAPTPTATPTDAAGLPVPAASAGPLDARTVPAALDLGHGWTAYVDPGDVAEGYTGNGSWVRACGAAEIVQAVVPLGCTGLSAPPDLPRPRHALEATYRGPKQAPAVAIVLDYGSDAQADRFLRGMARIARSCPRPARPVAADDPLAVVVTPSRVDATTVLDRREELGMGASEWLWSEAAVRDGRRVGLLIMGTAPAAANPDLAMLSTRLRAAIAR